MFYVVINLGGREQVMEPGYTNKAAALKARTTWRAMAARGERHNIDIQYLPHYESDKVMAQFKTEAAAAGFHETPAPHISHYELIDDSTMYTIARFTRLMLAIEAADKLAQGKLISGDTTPRKAFVICVYSNGDGYEKYHNTLCK